MQLVSIDGRIRALDGPFDAPGTGAIDLAALTGLPAGACRFLGAHGVEAARDKIGRATDIVPIAGVAFDPPIPKPAHDLGRRPQLPRPCRRDRARRSDRADACSRSRPGRSSATSNRS